MVLVKDFENREIFCSDIEANSCFIISFICPFLYWTDTSTLSDFSQGIYFYSAVMLSLLGFCVRAYTVGTSPIGTSGRNTVTKSFFIEYYRNLLCGSTSLYLGNYFMWIGICSIYL